MAVVSDAGTPAVSDPGARLVSGRRGGRDHGDRGPGPSAALAALVVSGLATDRFCFEGFLPRRGADRRRRLEAVAAEALHRDPLRGPGRLGATLGDLLGACGPERRVVVARELTKLHEEIWRGTLARRVARRSPSATCAARSSWCWPATPRRTVPPMTTTWPMPLRRRLGGGDTLA